VSENILRSVSEGRGDQILVVYIEYIKFVLPFYGNQLPVLLFLSCSELLLHCHKQRVSVSVELTVYNGEKDAINPQFLRKLNSDTRILVVQ
jgi:hypothetical protein